MRTKRKRRKKRIGTSLVCLLALILPAVEAGQKKATPESYALVAGTVFKESGFALPNATVTLLPDATTAPSAKVKTKKQQATCNTRGEFAFRVPPGSSAYRLTAAAKGFQSQEKSVSIQGEEHIDVTFQLPPESPK